MTVKVIVTGAYSTGKTTLSVDLHNTLIDRGMSCRLLPDISRSCPLPLNTEQADDTSLWLIGSQIASEIEAVAEAPDIVLCDRGIPDILAHQQDVALRRSDGSVALLRQFLDHWLSTYTLFLFSRVDEAVPIEPDGLRNTDPNYRSLLDRFAADVLKGSTNVVTLPFDPHARLDVALQAIRRLPRP